MAVATSLSTSNLLPSLEKHSSRYLGLRPLILLRTSNPLAVQTRSQCHLDHRAVISFSRLVVRAATKGSAKSSKSDERIPSWAKPDSDEPPPWAEDASKGNSPQSTFEISFYAYLLSSAITAIAAVFSSAFSFQYL